MAERETLERLDDGLWATKSELRFVGIKMTARTTIVRLADGLLVHSPGRLDADLQRELEPLGPVRALVAPNRFHHLFVGDWQKAYPEAETHVSPGLPKKRKKLRYTAVLEDQPPAMWTNQLEQVVIAGLPALSEVSFFHPATRTLINTDTTHNVQADPSFVARTLWRMMGSYKKFGPSRLERWLTKDKPALKASIERVLAWDFRRVIVAHGDVFERDDARDALRKSWSWLLAN